ncbi:PAS domain-containing sensor histidine kinase [Maribacter sp. ACAM166]|uniref:PAS domain-containing sensor histidine kinase n=1 Tax=Maribacter sp. ACAM166 TaxID=2508996 RepID=UPI0010FD50B1|nr:PAS domain-containing sensor histidine kinase [Maribacter sp. ACAM166]TLP80168.1 PAS domain S-box protein [Maribacter sp. ACAM166]
MQDKSTLQELKNQIVELKKQNEILRLYSSFQNNEEIEKYTHSIFDNMGDAVFVKDDQSRLIFVNDAFCRMINLSRPEMIGKTLAEHVPLVERESFLKIDQRVLTDGLENINEESLTVRGRQTIMISTRKSRFIDSNEKKFLIGVVRDITDRKKSEQILKEREAQFRELNVTKDKLLSIIGHDLRGPFINILTLSELLVEDVEDLDVVAFEQYLGMINSIAKNALTLLDDLLRWAKLQTGELNYKSEKIYLSSTIQEVVARSNSIAKAKNIALNQIKSDNIEVFSDKEMFKTVLRNLISNAIKFTKPGGNIDVYVISKQDQVEITVSDDGVGINEETSKKLFGTSANISSLGTAKEKGFGFGLTLCTEIMEKLGGTIRVESEVGVGSDFKFTLPLKKT